MVSFLNTMREVLESLGEGYNWYRARRPEFETGQKIPFRISPQPFFLTQIQAREIMAIGKDIVAFFQAVDELYKTESEERDLLNRGKPEIFQRDREARYLFVRPDLILTDTGFIVCEIETSPFGLALAELLNRGYIQAGFDTIVGNNTFSDYIRANTPEKGIIVYSQNTASYSGQMNFLANEVFSGKGRRWQAERAEFVVGMEEETEGTAVYRAFYQHEYLEDLFVYSIMDDYMTNDIKGGLLPSFTPHLEEKAILACVWDSRWEDFLVKRLGQAAFRHLREVVPPTWIVGEEQHFAFAVDLSLLPRSKRPWVLKKSGFGSGSSWSEGVNFLHKKPAFKARAALLAARSDAESLYIIQQFKRGRIFDVSYEDNQGAVMPMKARFRLLPYFSMARGCEGQLIAIKATGCENTDYIHTTSASVNMAVAQK